MLAIIDGPSTGGCWSCSTSTSSGDGGSETSSMTSEGLEAGLSGYSASRSDVEDSRPWVKRLGPGFGEECGTLRIILVG